MNCFIHPAVYLAETAHKGRGVFCHQALAADELIEVSPVIVIDPRGRKQLQETLLSDYIFGWTGDDGARCCVGLGYLSLYNHSYLANCHYEKDYEAQTMRIRTVRRIPAGEELSINYNGVWDDPSPIWFEAF